MAIKIHNQAACEAAMMQAWRDWHQGVVATQIPDRPTISFEKGFRYAYMLLELKEAEFDLEFESAK